MDSRDRHNRAGSRARAINLPHRITGYSPFARRSALFSRSKVKVVKPQRIALTSRPFELGGECFLAVTTMFMVPFGQPRVLSSEAALWKLAAKELGSMVLDEGMPKSRGEVLVCGRASAAGLPVPALEVRVRVGSIDKALAVVGDRQWRGDVAGSPAPFEELPITWERAFGGPKNTSNPVGRPLPNIEDPRKLVMSRRHRGQPVGYGPLDLTWAERARHAGTYDAHWLENHYPGFPRDMSWDVFNRAPSDQWLTGFFEGSETFTADNLHPGRARVEGTVPRLGARCFLRCENDASLRELPLRADTLWLFPHVEQAILAFHGMLRIGEHDGADVKYLVAACDDPHQQRPMSHFEEVLAQRLDKEKGALLAMDDEPLLPPWPELDAAAQTAASAPEGLMLRNMQRGQRAQNEAARQRLANMGLIPDEYLPPTPPDQEEPPLTDPVKLQAMAEALQLEAAENKAKLEAKQQQMRQRAQELGVDVEDPGGGPPTFSAAAELARMRQMAESCRGTPGFEAVLAMADDPELPARLEKAEAQTKEGYRLTAHQQAPARPLPFEEADRRREKVVRALENKQSLAGWDLTGVDLRGLSFEDVDMQGAFCEGAQLEGCSLARARLGGAVLARADLTGACLDDADLDGANLGASKLVDASLRRTSMTNGILSGAELAGCRLHEAKLENAQFLQARLAGAVFTRAALPRAVFLDLDMNGVVFDGACLDKANFISCHLGSASFNGASLVGTTYLGCVIQEASFMDATMTNAVFVLECKLEGASFQRASMKGANLRAMALARSDFSAATLDAADLSGADLRQAVFYRAVARGARFGRADLREATFLAANLMEASFEASDLRGTNLGSTNMYGVDFARVIADGATVVHGANQKRARTLPRRRS